MTEEKTHRIFKVWLFIWVPRLSLDYGSNEGEDCPIQVSTWLGLVLNVPQSLRVWYNPTAVGDYNTQGIAAREWTDFPNTLSR